MSQIIPKVSASDLQAVANLADENIITEDELSLVSSGAQGGFAFDGNDYLDGPSDDVGTSDFTVVFDLLWDDAPSAVEVLAVKGNGGNNRWTVDVTATQYRLQIIDNVGSTNTYTWTVTPSVNHRNVIVSADRSGNATLYLNGASQGTRDISATSSVNLGSGNTNPLRLGNNSFSFDGKMFQVRYYTEAKTSAQVLNIAKGHNDTDNLFLKLAPTSTNESGWTDVSGNNRSFTANGATRIESNISKNYTSHSEYTALQKKDGGFYLTGSSQYLEAPAFSFGTGDFSVSYDIDLKDTSGSKYFFYSSNTATNSMYTGYEGSNYIVAILDNGGSATKVTFNAPVFTGKQNHTIVVDRDGNASFWLNGELLDTGDISAASTVDIGLNNTAGANINNRSAYGYNCEAKSVRVFNYALSDDDVQEYSRGAATKFVDKAEGLEPSGSWSAATSYSYSSITSTSSDNLTIGLTGGTRAILPLNKQTWKAGKKYRFSGIIDTQNATLNFYNPSSTTGGGAGNTSYISIDATNTPTAFSYEWTNNSTYNWNESSFLGIIQTAGGSVTATLTNFEITEIVEVASYLPTSATKSVWEDCSGLFNHATNSGATLLTPSLQETYTKNQELVSSRVGTGAGYRTNGTNYINIPITIVNGATAFSFVFGTEFLQTTGNSEYFYRLQGLTGATLGFDFIRGQTGNIDFRAVNTAGLTTLFTYGPVEPGDRNIFVFVWDGVNYSFYKNGKKIHTDTVPVGYDLPIGVNNYWLGNNNASFAGDLVWSGNQFINRALTASEVLAVSRGQRPGFADVGADGTATYSSDFSAGVDGWSASGGSGSAPETVDGRTDTYKFTTNTISGTKYISGKTLVVGKRYRAKYSFYVDASNDVIDGIAIRDGVSTLKSHKSVTAGQWHDETFEFIATGTNFNIAFQDGASGNINDAGGDDFVALKAIEITALGEVLALLPSSAATGKWYNEGGAGSSGDGTVTGATLINERKRGVFDNLYLDNVPSSSAGLSAGEIYRDGSGHLKIVT